MQSTAQENSKVEKKSVTEGDINLAEDGVKDKEFDFCSRIIIVCSYLLFICTFPVSIFFCIIVVKEYERAVILRLGRLRKSVTASGLVFLLPCVDEFSLIDLRTVSFDVPPQVILTKDSVSVAVDAVVYYHVKDATLAIMNVHDYTRSTQLLASVTLRNMFGMQTLSGILEERDMIAEMMKSHLEEATDPWGVKVERIDIRDVNLPIQMQRAMAAEAEASREARAKVIAADGEHKAAKALMDAATVISQSPGAMQLRYLQTLTSIATERNSTIVFPLPIELFSTISSQKNIVNN